MDQNQIAKQMIDFQKATFDNTFNGLVMFQDQTEKAMNTFLEQGAGIPVEGKKAVSEWVAACKKGRDDFKKTVDENFKKVATFFEKAPSAK
jgi:hypothetical protein